MAVDNAKSLAAPMLDLELDEDVMFSLREFSRVYGNRPMTQASQKALQALLIVYSGLAVKERCEMSKFERDRAASKCMQEVAVPGFIKLIERAQEQSGGTLPMPYKWKDLLYYTTLGTGKSRACTFMQKPEAVLNRLKNIKTEFTKVWEWFDKNGRTDNPADLPSGTNTQVSLQELNEAMFFESDGYKKQLEKAEAEAAKLLGPLTGASGAGTGAGSADPTQHTPAPGAGTEPNPAAGIPAGAGPAALAALAATAVHPQGVPSPGVGTGGAATGPAALAALAAASIRQEGAGAAAGGRRSEEDGEEVPDGWFFSNLILAAAYSPWSGRAPSEWKYLQSSSGPTKRKSDIILDADNPVCNPAAMARLNPNGDAFSRRQHYAALKKEKEVDQKAAREKENRETRKEALQAMKAANDHDKAIGDNIRKMVDLKEKEAEQNAREMRIKALEKKVMLGLGDPVAVKAELARLFDEC